MANRVRGTRTLGQQPQGIVLGRKRGSAAGTGPVYAISLLDLAGQLGATGGVLTPGSVQPLPSIADDDLLANISGGSAVPVGVTATAFFDDVFGNTKGMILYRDTSAWLVLAIGTVGQVLTVAAGIPSWATPSGGGGSAPNGMLPLVTGETPGPIPIADGAGQFIGVPL